MGQPGFKRGRAKVVSSIKAVWCGARASRASAVTERRASRWAVVLLVCGVGHGIMAAETSSLNDIEKMIRAAREKDLRDTPRRPFIPPGVDTPEFLRFEQGFQRGAQCGPNAVLAMLRAHGVPANLEEVAKRLAVGDEGASMADMKRVLEQYGLVCKLRKQVSPSELREAPLPAIVHLTVPGTSPSEQETDHFALIGPYSEAEEGFLGIDTTSLVRAKFFPRSLTRSMSGKALFVVGGGAAGAHGRLGIAEWTAGALLAVVVLANVAVPLYARSQRLSKRPR